MRLFLAVWPPPSVVEALAAAQHAWAWPPAAARVPPERMHLTLHFLGAVEARQVDALRAGLAVVFEPFVLALAGARARVWPGGIAVLELQAPAPLQRLHERLGLALQALGLPVEARAFRPHVTFARKAAGAVPAPAPDCDWMAREGYALVRSTPGRGYDTLQTYGPHRLP